MGMSTRGALFALVLVFLLWTRETGCEPVGGMEQRCRDIGRREDCVAAAEGGEGCLWCDLPERCVSASRVREVGAASCFLISKVREQSSRLLNENECFSIPTKDLCSRMGYCKWCRSEVLDDTCFGAAEAARLPRTIFLCADVS